MIDLDKLNEEIEEIGEYIKEDDYDGAYEIIEELLKEYDGMYKETENERFFAFDSPIQFYLYDMFLKSDKYLRRCDIDYRTLYLSKGHIDMAYDRFYECEEALSKALYWNPVDPNVFYELARLFIKTKEINKLKIVIKAVRNYILDKVSYAKYYAYLGEFYRLKEDYKTAIALYYVSESILETPVAKEGIEYILEREDILNPPATEEVIETLKKDEFEFNLNSEVLGMIYDLSYELSKNLNNKSAMYCLDVLYELTDDEKYLREKEYLE
ncbi:MAG: hypothetical protein E7419_03335 [Ruminococcaceae bacterium]|nr:hypothetical protein [Oscillospiraceae bacterium]